MLRSHRGGGVWQSVKDAVAESMMPVQVEPIYEQV
jgi:hypothetical protein